MEISEILPQLFLGPVQHPREKTAEFINLNIDIIINCCDDYTHKHSDTYIIENYPINDGFDATISDFLDPIAESINQHMCHNKRVYVHCIQGRSRSVSILIYYLIKFKNMSFDEAFEKIQKNRPIILPNPNFILEIKKKII